VKIHFAEIIGDDSQVNVAPPFLFAPNTGTKKDNLFYLTVIFQ
jgi:hypothetical protein